MSPPTLTPEVRATQVYADLIRDLSERGLGDVWQSIDVDTRNVEIRPAWQALILAALRATEQETWEAHQREIAALTADLAQAKAHLEAVLETATEWDASSVIEAAEAYLSPSQEPR